MAPFLVCLATKLNGYRGNCAGVFTDGSLLATALREVVNQEKGLIDGGATLSAMLVAFTKYAGEDVLGLKSQWRLDLDIFLAHEKERLANNENKKVADSESADQVMQDAEQDRQTDQSPALNAEDQAKFDEAVQELLQLAKRAEAASVVDAATRAQVREVVDGAFEVMSKELVNQHKNLRLRELDNRKKLALKGDLSDETLKAFEKRKAEYEKVKTSVSAVSEALLMPMPDLPKDPEDETRLSDAVWVHTGGKHPFVRICMQVCIRACGENTQFETHLCFQCILVFDMQASFEGTHTLV